MRNDFEIDINLCQIKIYAYINLNLYYLSYLLLLKDQNALYVCLIGLNLV